MCNLFHLLIVSYSDSLTFKITNIKQILIRNRIIIVTYLCYYCSITTPIYIVLHIEHIFQILFNQKSFLHYLIFLQREINKRKYFIVFTLELIFSPWIIFKQTLDGYVATRWTPCTSVIKSGRKGKICRKLRLQRAIERGDEGDKDGW